MKDWIKNLLFFVGSIVLVIIVIFSAFWFKYYRMDIRKEACGEEYMSKFDSEQQEYQIRDKCHTNICSELNLRHDGHGNWDKAIIYCQTKSGGEIKVDMPQFVTGECGDYFNRRWIKAHCLYKARYIEELT